MKSHEIITNIYVVFKLLINSVCKNRKKSQKVLVIVDGLIGDAVLCIDFLNELAEWFGKRGYQIDCFVSKKFVRDFIENYTEIVGINFLDIEYDEKEVYLRDLQKVVAYFSNEEYEYVINPLAKYKGDKLVACLSAKYKYATRDDQVLRGKPFSSIFKKVCYTKTINVSISEMELVRYKRLLNYLGDKAYKIKRGKLKFHTANRYGLNKGSYCVIAPGSSEAGKKWEAEKFSKLIEYIKSKYGFDIVLVGGNSEVNDAEALLSYLDNKNDVIDLTGKTNYDEWISIISGAAFLVGNDSASVHIAASVKCPSVCIIGKWHYKRFAPYIVDEDMENLPVAVFCDGLENCTGCRKIIGQMKNRECKDRAMNGQSFTCINKIQVDQVLIEIDRIVERS